MPMTEHEHRLRAMAERLADLVKLADEDMDFVLAAKIEDAHCTLLERLEASSGLPS